ncbi:MAG: type II toxin-antitoxin system PemK/MazF family toxin [Actinomycetota bacterium]|nr:type II toxin-antitoxin system PemK/MazF family toxin [Actinomycetota bacterium]
MVKRGEIWWYEPPDTKRRPHLIITRGSVIPYLRDVLAVPATRTRRGIPTEVDLYSRDGMPADCVLTTDNLTLITTAYLRERITVLSADQMNSVCEAITIATGC